MKKNPAEKIIVALDYADGNSALEMAHKLSGTGVRFKVGMELFYAEGKSIIEKISQHGEIFLDLKLHDIPETMAKTAAVLTQTGAWMFNVHASAGTDALKRVAETTNTTAQKNNLRKPLLIAVTVLTSLKDFSHLGSNQPPETLAVNLAQMSVLQGLDGVVCSPNEVKAIKKAAPSCLCVTPGIRRPDDAANDQTRTATPKEAFLNGSDYLVIGRPVTRTNDPLSSLQKIITESSC